MSYNNLKPLHEVLEEQKKKGYEHDFFVKDGLLRAYDDKKTYEPHQVKIDEHFRFEGESNPDDDAIVYLISCDDGKKGVISAAYKTTNEDEVEEFIEKIESPKP
jgi:hypothetical protein